MYKKVLYFTKKHTVNITDFEKKKMLLLTEKELTLHQDFIVCYICRKKITQKLAKCKSYRPYELRDHCHFAGKWRGAAYSICKLRLMYVMKFLYFFAMNQTMIIILSKN